MAKKRRNPIFAQRELTKSAPTPIPPPPPTPTLGGAAPAAASAVADVVKANPARQALETLPDLELHKKAEVLLPDYEEGDDWDRATLIDALLAAGATA